VIAETFDPEGTTRQLRDQHATPLPGSPPFVQAFLDFQDRHPECAPLFPSGRVMMHGGSPKPPTLHFVVRERFGTAGVVSGYGMTECPMAIWASPNDPDQKIATTEGRPVQGVELRIVGPDESDVPAGEEGEVRLRGPQMMKGYVDASLDAEAFDERGFLRSGDLGRVDPEGFLTITGRLKEIIIRNMENISATELEGLLYDHPKVVEVAIIGLPNERLGEHACAVVVPADPENPPTLAELTEHLLAKGLSERKLPEQLALVSALPRNAMEKVQKNVLRESIASDPAR